MSNKLLWWAYIHVNGSLHIKRYFDPRDLEEAHQSDFVSLVINPSSAVTQSEFSDIVYRKLYDLYNLVYVYDNLTKETYLFSIGSNNFKKDTFPYFVIEKGNSDNSWFLIQVDNANDQHLERQYEPLKAIIVNKGTQLENFPKLKM